MTPQTGGRPDPDTEDDGLAALDLKDAPGRARPRWVPVIAAVAILAGVAVAVWVGVGHVRPARDGSQGPTDSPAFGNDPNFGTSVYLSVDTVRVCSDDRSRGTGVQRVYYDRDGQLVTGSAPNPSASSPCP